MHPDINNTISMSDPRVLRSHAQVKAHKLTTQPQHSKDEGHGHRVRGGARTRFLSLPPEIRNEIYKLITETDLILFYDKFWYPKAPARPSSRIANTTWPACFDHHLTTSFVNMSKRRPHPKSSDDPRCKPDLDGMHHCKHEG